MRKHPQIPRWLHGRLNMLCFTLLVLLTIPRPAVAQLKYLDDLLHEHFIGHEKSIGSVAFSPDGKMIASSSADHTVKLWDVATRKVIRTLAGPSWVSGLVRFTPDGKELITGAGELKGHQWVPALRFWDLTTWTFQDVPYDRPETGPGDLSWDGKYLAMATKGPGLGKTMYGVKVTTARSGQVVATLLGHEKELSVSALSPDGNLLATHADGERFVRVWDLATQRLRRDIFFPRLASVKTLAFSPDGRLLAMGGEAGWRGREVGDGPVHVLLWDVQTGQEKAAWKAKHLDVQHLLFSPDGSALAGVSGSMLNVWEVASGRLSWRTPGFGGISAFAFSPDGKKIVNGGTSNDVRLWNVPPWTE